MSERWTFSIEWTERIADPRTDTRWRTIAYGEVKSYDTETKAHERRQWHVDNMGSWTPETAIDASVSHVAKRGEKEPKAA